MKGDVFGDPDERRRVTDGATGTAYLGAVAAIEFLKRLNLTAPAHRE